MTGRDFAYWLQGLFELGDPKSIDERQTALIKQHLALVFVHEIDPSAGGPEHQAKLNEVHNPSPPSAGVTLTEKQVKQLIKDAAADNPLKPHSHPYQRPPVMRC